MTIINQNRCLSYEKRWDTSDDLCKKIVESLEPDDDLLNQIIVPITPTVVMVNIASHVLLASLPSLPIVDPVTWQGQGPVLAVTLVNVKSMGTQLMGTARKVS